MHADGALALRAKMLGVLMRDARTACGLSPQECARTMGIPPATLASFETGRRPFSLPELEAFALAVNLPVLRLLHPDRLFSQDQRAVPNLRSVIELRQRMIAVRLRQFRTEKGVSRSSLASQTGISSRRISSFEAGQRPIPLPELEALARALGVEPDSFLDPSGPAKERELEHKAVEQFQKLPQDIRDFLTHPINEPYLRLAMRMSELPAERLRTIAEGILEITL
jgi:transcriptional regulator with XRE-family HTH domain